MSAAPRRADARARRFQQNPEHPVISDLFLQYAPFFKMYSEYISHLEKNILPLLRKLTKGKSRFAEYNAGVEATSGTTLEEFLTLPARHISLYTDQLRRLVEAVEKKDKEYEQLQKAHAVMQQVSSAITTNLETRKNLDVVAELEKKFVVNPKFSKPGRYIIRWGRAAARGRARARALTSAQRGQPREEIARNRRRRSGLPRVPLQRHVRLRELRGSGVEDETPRQDRH
jgi:hypothetical protein